MDDEAREPDPAQDEVGRSGVLIPRWLKVFALVALAIALALLAHVVIGGGSHGPSLHGSSAVDHAAAALAGVGAARL